MGFNDHTFPKRRVEEVCSEWYQTISLIPRTSSISGKLIWGIIYKRTFVTKIGVYVGDTEITEMIWKRDGTAHRLQQHREDQSRRTEYAKGIELFEAKLKGEEV